MTNFEWIKSDDKRLKATLIHGLAVNADTGKMERCYNINCSLCSFSNSKHEDKPCQQLREEWLNKEHEPYKKGDVVLTWSDHVYLVISNSEYRDKISVASNVFNLDIGRGVFMNKDNIRQKIGNIYEDTASEIAYELAGHVNILKKEE